MPKRLKIFKLPRDVKGGFATAKPPFTVIVAFIPRVHLTGAVYLLDILFRYLTKYLNKSCRNAPSISSPWG